MGWAREMMFLGGYLSPVVLAEEIALERAAEAANAASTEAGTSPATSTPARAKAEPATCHAA